MNQNLLTIPLNVERKRVVDYTIASMDDVDELAVYVRNGLAMGWQPIGGISCHNGWWSQALVMYEGEDLRKKGDSDGSAKQADSSSVA